MHFCNPKEFLNATKHSENYGTAPKRHLGTSCQFGGFQVRNDTLQIGPEDPLELQLVSREYLGKGALWHCTM